MEKHKYTDTDRVRGNFVVLLNNTPHYESEFKYYLDYLREDSNNYMVIIFDTANNRIVFEVESTHNNVWFDRHIVDREEFETLYFKFCEELTIATVRKTVEETGVLDFSGKYWLLMVLYGGMKKKFLNKLPLDKVVDFRIGAMPNHTKKHKKFYDFSLFVNMRKIALHEIQRMFYLPDNLDEIIFDITTLKNNMIAFSALTNGNKYVLSVAAAGQMRLTRNVTYDVC